LVIIKPKLKESLQFLLSKNLGSERTCQTCVVTVELFQLEAMESDVETMVVSVWESFSVASFHVT
jgi:hypothetical protein